MRAPIGSGARHGLLFARDGRARRGLQLNAVSTPPPPNLYFIFDLQHARLLGGGLRLLMAKGVNGCSPEQSHGPVLAPSRRDTLHE